MAANTDPIFSRLSDFQGGKLLVTAASNVHDSSGTIGTDIISVFTPDATNGGFIQKVRFKYMASGTNTGSNAAVIKLWIVNISAGNPNPGTQAWLYDEIAVPATGTLSTTATAPIYEVPFNFALPPTYAVMCKITVSQPTNCGWLCVAIAGKY